MLTTETKTTIKGLTKEAMKELFLQNDEEKMLLRVYSRANVKRMLGISFGTIQKLVEEGYLKLTEDERFITLASIKKYVNANNAEIKDLLGRLETSQQ